MAKLVNKIHPLDAAMRLVDLGYMTLEEYSKIWDAEVKKLDEKRKD